MSHHVFISYRRQPCGWLSVLLKTQFEVRDVSCFLDVDDLDLGRFDTGIRTAIERCTVFLLVLTPGSLERLSDPGDWVMKEIQHAVATKRRIVMVRSDPTIDPSTSVLPEEVRNLNAADIHLRSWQKDCQGLLDTLSIREIEEQEQSARAHEQMRHFDQVSKDEAFITWRNCFLEDWIRRQPLYSRLKGSTQVAVCPEFAGTTYPVICIPAADPDKQFRHDPASMLLADPARPVRQIGDPRAHELPSWIGHGDVGGIRARYFEILSRANRVKRWDMCGYALSGLHLDAELRVTGFSADACTYGENCLTSHLCGYAMYEQYCTEQQIAIPYRSLQDQPADIAVACRPALGPGIIQPDGQTTLFNITMPDGFYPLISVQAMIMFRDPDRDDVMSVVTMERGGNVAAAAGFWQFPPAGGFEVYGREDDRETWLRDQFDIRKALIRETLEEVFGDMDMTCESQDSARAHQQASDGYKQILRAIKDKRISVHFLGVVTELVSLRTEFSFLMIIEDQSLLDLSYDVMSNNTDRRKARWLAGSHENKGRLIPIPVTELSAKMASSATWHTSSAGMAWLLARQAQDPTGWLRNKIPELTGFNLPPR